MEGVQSYWLPNTAGEIVYINFEENQHAKVFDDVKDNKEDHPDLNIFQKFKQVTIFNALGLIIYLY